MHVYIIETIWKLTHLHLSVVVSSTKILLHVIWLIHNSRDENQTNQKFVEYNQFWNVELSQRINTFYHPKAKMNIRNQI